MEWLIEIIKRLPWFAAPVIASFFFFKYTNQEMAAWILFGVAIIVLFLIIRIENYEKIIDRQEVQIEKYSTLAQKAHTHAFKVTKDTTADAAGFAKNSYSRADQNQTDVA